MTDIILSAQNGEPVASSRQIAESFGKEHRNVMRDIDSLLEGGALKNEQTPMFYKTEYVHEQNGQTYPMYLMNRDGFSLLVMGFTGKAALEWKLKYIAAFNEMEKKLTQPKEMSRMELISRALIAANEEINELTTKNALLAEKNEGLTPKGEYYDKLVEGDSLLSLTDTAKILKIPPRKFTKKLVDYKFLFHRSEHGSLIPYEETNLGYFEVKNRQSSKTKWNGAQTLTTVKGRQKFLEMKEKGFFD